jgi:hypothetical protein
LAGFGRAARAGQVVPCGLREGRERGVDRGGGSDQRHESLILNIWTGGKFANYTFHKPTGCGAARIS